MKTIVFAAAMLALTTGIASAGEGGSPQSTPAPLPTGPHYTVPDHNVTGNPFPYTTTTTAFLDAAPLHDTGSAAYQAADGAPMLTTVGHVLKTNSNEGEVMTANSLPLGFEDGALGDVGNGDNLGRSASSGPTQPHG